MYFILDVHAFLVKLHGHRGLKCRAQALGHTWKDFMAAKELGPNLSAEGVVNLPFVRGGHDGCSPLSGGPDLANRE